MCDWCGEGWRFEAVHLGGPNAGQVKAVLHPITGSWEQLWSAVSDGSLKVATRDPAPDDVWGGSTGIYISQVLSDGSRKCHFGGYTDDLDASGGGDTEVSLRSIDGFLDKRLVMGANDPWGITLVGSTVTVVKPTSPTTTVPVYTATITPTLSGFAQFLVQLARGDLVPDSSPGATLLRAEVVNGGAVFADQTINWWDAKNVGGALRELVEAENGTKYHLEHNFDNGVWESVMVFNQASDAGTAREYTIRSDIEARGYGLSLDATDKATRVYGFGSGSEGSTMFSVAYDADTIDNLPEHQVTVAWKDVTIADKLDALTRGYVADHRDPIATPTATIMGLPDYDPDAPGYDPQKGFPGPDILQPGDTFQASIGYGVITCDDLPVRALGVSWDLSAGSTVERTIAMQPLARANTSIRTQTPAKVPAPTTPTPTTPVTSTPWPTPGLVTKVKASGLTEISGMEVSRANPGKVALFNDEVSTQQVKYVDLKTGNQYSTVEFNTGLPSLGDPESIRYSVVSAKMVLSDTGDNDTVRPTSGADQPALYTFTEPKWTGNKTVTVTKLPIRYPGGEKVNCEALLIHPTTNQVYLMSKEVGRSRVFSFGTLQSMGTGSGDNVGSLVATIDFLSEVSDACHTWGGGFVLVRQKGVGATGVLKASSWARSGFINTPSMFQSEAICAESTCAFLTSTETKKDGGYAAPIYRVLIDRKWGALCGTTSGSSGTGTGTPVDPAKKVPGQVLNLNAWKLTLPTGSGNKPKELTQPQLATFELKPNFYTDNGTSVIFRAAVTGVTTSGSSYPRSELRQMTGNGSDEAAWSNKTQTWTMEGRLRFVHLPGDKPHVVGMQIHDSNDDVTVLRLEGSDLYVTKGDDTHYDLIDGSYALGTWITVKVVAKKGGGIDWYLNGTKVATVAGVFSGCYFKAGCYTQANESNGTGYGQTEFSSLKVTRS